MPFEGGKNNISDPTKIFGEALLCFYLRSVMLLGFNAGNVVLMALLGLVAC